MRYFTELTLLLMADTVVGEIGANKIFLKPAILCLAVTVIGKFLARKT